MVENYLSKVKRWMQSHNLDKLSIQLLISWRDLHLFMSPTVVWSFHFMLSIMRAFYFTHAPRCASSFFCASSLLCEQKLLYELSILRSSLCEKYILCELFVVWVVILMRAVLLHELPILCSTLCEQPFMWALHFMLPVVRASLLFELLIIQALHFMLPTVRTKPFYSCSSLCEQAL